MTISSQAADPVHTDLPVVALTLALLVGVFAAFFLGVSEAKTHDRLSAYVSANGASCGTATCLSLGPYAVTLQGDHLLVRLDGAPVAESRSGALRFTSEKVRQDFQAYLVQTLSSD